MRRRRDSIRDCTVHELEDGRRALELWVGYKPPGLKFPHLKFDGGRWYYVLDPVTAADLMEAVLRGEITDERQIEMLERMMTTEEWAVLAETLRMVAPPSW